MTEIGPYLERLGLERYHDAFIAEGFDTWDILLDIKEGDLCVKTAFVKAWANEFRESLNVKLGHRRVRVMLILVHVNGTDKHNRSFSELSLNTEGYLVIVL